jgi:hypothetical protein
VRGRVRGERRDEREVRGQNTGASAVCDSDFSVSGVQPADLDMAPACPPQKQMAIGQEERPEVGD